MSWKSRFWLRRDQNLADLPSASTARTNLGLGSAATQASSAFDAAGAATAAQNASLQKTSNLGDVSNAGTAKTNLGILKADIDLGDASGAASSVMSGAHGLGTTPFMCLAFAVNVSGATQNGYAAGAYVHITMGGTSRNDGVSITWDSTNVKVVVGANGVLLMNANTFNGDLVGGLGTGHWHVHALCLVL